MLDYDVDSMAEYVAEMSTRLVNQNQNQAAPSFRKFVNQILTSTRLPRTTILLGMNYLAKRINMLKAAGSDQFASEGQIWRMLTTSLLLGSKFLDDNTFQNRSWSEVSGLSVSELNSLESQWLVAIGWNLYVNLEESKDYNAWLHNWDDWIKEKREKQAQQARQERLSNLAPLDTEIHHRNGRAHHWIPQQNEYDRMARCKQHYPSQSYRRDNWQALQYQQPQNPWHHPLTPPDSAYNTPEYVSATSSATARYNDWFAQAAASTNMPSSFQCSSHSGYQSSHVANYNTYYAHVSKQHYGQTFYDHGVLDCNCANCHPNKQHSYFMSQQNYGQPVAG